MCRYLAIGTCVLFLEFPWFAMAYIKFGLLDALFGLVVGFFPVFMGVIFMHSFISWAEEKDCF